MNASLESVPAADASQLGRSRASRRRARRRPGVPGDMSLHHGGSCRPAHRLAPRRPRECAGGLALGGISAHRRVCAPKTAAGLVERDRRTRHARSIPTRFRVLSIDYLGGSGESTGPDRRSAFPSISSYDQADALVAAARSPRHQVAARHCRRLVRRHGRAGLRRAVSGARRTTGRHQRRGSCRIPWPPPGAACSAVSCACGSRRGQPAATAWSWRARWPCPPIAAPRNSRRAFAAAPRWIRRGASCSRWRNTCFARGATTRRGTLPESFLCLSESIDLHSVDATRILRADRSGRRARGPARAAGRHARAGRAAARRAACTRFPRCIGHDAFLKEAEQLRPILADRTPGDVRHEPTRPKFTTTRRARRAGVRRHHRAPSCRRST